MASGADKQTTPALVSYSAFVNFMDKFREHGDVPTRIDRSLMPSASGSFVFALIGSLKFLQLIDESGKPSDEFVKLTLADNEARKPLLADLLRRRYDFLFEDASFKLDKATSGEMAERFRALDISGSTVTKAISFFLGAAKEAGIKVSPHIKPPPAPVRPVNGSKKTTKRKEEAAAAGVDGGDDDDQHGDVERFEIPVPGKTSVKVIVPSDLDADDWEMLQSMITVYIKRWKGFKTKAESE